MNKIILHIFIYIGVCVSFATASCAHANPEDIISQAEAEMEAGDSDAARNALSELESTYVDNLSAKQKCRMAMIYIRMAEISDEQDDMAAAASVFMMALATDPDSTAAYIENLSIDQQRHASMLIELTRGMSSPDSIPTDEYPDSIH